MNDDTVMRRDAESTGYLEVFAWSGSLAMVTSIFAMVAVFIKIISDDKGMPIADAEALVSMAARHAKQTGDSQVFTTNHDRRRGRRTGVSCNRGCRVGSVCSLGLYLMRLWCALGRQVMVGTGSYRNPGPNFEVQSVAKQPMDPTGVPQVAFETESKPAAEP